MRTHKAVLLVAVVGLVLGACRPESQKPAKPAQPSAQISNQQQQLMEEILGYLKQSGSTLETLAREVQRRETLERVPSGIERLGTDVRVAKALVSAARRAATAKSTEKTAGTLGRLGPVLVGLRSQIPAALITQHLERALVAISTSSAEEAVNLASAYLLGAVDVAMKAPARLVPDVMKDIEKAKARVDGNNLTKGANQILTILERLSEHESISLVEKAIGEARSAQEAVAREAWPVVAAELDQLDRLLAELQEKIEGEVTAVEAEEVPEVEEEELAPEEAPAEAEEAMAPIPEAAAPAD